MSESKKKQRNYLVSALCSALFVAIVKHFWPDVIPFDVFSFWHTRGRVGDWVVAAWPVFAWGALATLALSIFRRTPARTLQDAEGITVTGLFISAWAGVTEEISFRWLIFLSSIVTVKIGNFLFFGFLGWGLPEHLNAWIFAPLADWTTLGMLHGELYHPAGWAVGAAILASNAAFRNGHKYQGVIGFINSWFVGMFFFWIMFSYGLPAAILVHFLYDAVVFGAAYFKMFIERGARGLG